MATPKFNSKSPTIRRILREAQELSASPSADYTATPLESDLFEWHFTLRGPPNSAYAGGIYHGRIVLPAGYPLRPPSFRFVTPSGRFETNREICLSISGHHEETWQPAWGVRTALVALRSFMETDAKGQLGGLDTSDAVRRRLATESQNFRCTVCARTNDEIMREHEAASGSSSAAAEVVEVPSELKLAWRDELDKAKGSGGETTAEDSESAELAEGFVQTAPLLHQPEDQVPVDTATVPAQSGQSVPQPTRTIPLPNSSNPHGQQQQQQLHQQQPQQQLQQQARRGVSNDDQVNLWIDRMIVVLGVALAALILKVLAA
ncbi:ubiquitin-conjugating enzyme/RWD-like protein [Apodospora peruviana]|uniref:Ubiquitin-conjugating enzyme/RWD-like protein n=1 Tax=Apodospora peruviana TaxID=516989 RepID=A0AAE0IIH5_9PEZI|nr:ubiquitin-conjugating enzyme/RWD-like protein [Apodospora peruviana]